MDSMKHIERDLHRRRAAVEDELRRLVSQLRTDADRIERNLDEDYHLNRFGEIQGTGTKIDQYVLLREELVESLNRVRHLIEAEEEETS